MKKIGLVALFALLLAGCDDGGEKKAQENLRKATPPAHAASSAFPASGHSGDAARVSLRGTPPLGIAQIRLMNRVLP